MKTIRDLAYGTIAIGHAARLLRGKRASHGFWKHKPDPKPIPPIANTNVILGISAHFHDSSAAILMDGKLIAAAEEERFTRRKHDPGFPYNAIRYCLSQAGISAADVGAVAYFEDPYEKAERVMDMLMDELPKRREFQEILRAWSTDKFPGCVKASLRKMDIYAETVFLDHHLAHAASSYLLSGFDEAAILTIDGVGEKSTTTLGYGKDDRVILKQCIEFPHSIGLFYSAATAYLGFKVNNDEYKVMGLASYGKPERFLSRMKQLIEIKEDGSFSLNRDFFCFGRMDRMFTEKLVELFGVQTPDNENEITQDHMDIAAALQKTTEDAVFAILHRLHGLVPSRNLCIAGGVGLNSVLNGKILSNTPYEDLFIQAAAGDSGTAIGAAKYIYHSLNPGKPREVMRHSYYGPGFSEAEIKEFLDKNNIRYTEFESERDLLGTTARLVYENNVVGWFQGRMEWGPRALGNRSILANPCNPDMKDILNQKVKHREMFRPFAPVVCAEDAEEFFEIDKPLPAPADYMLMVYPVKEGKREKLPSITHIDGSGRLQSIRHGQNPLYHDLIKEFGKLSGEPVLINTSFNIRGEPIVCTPQDAYNCMKGTEIDYLVIGRFLVRRSDNL